MAPRPGAVGESVISETAAWSWLDRTGFGPVAFLLLVHPEPKTGARLARSLRLVPPARRLPYVGERVEAVGASHAAVRIDGCEYLMRIPVGQRWATFVGSGGPVALVVGLAPLGAGAGAADIERYLVGAALGDRLRVGISRPMDAR